MSQGTAAVALTQISEITRAPHGTCQLMRMSVRNTFSFHYLYWLIIMCSRGLIYSDSAWNINICILSTPDRGCIFSACVITAFLYDDVIKWKHFPRNWPFVRGIHRSPVNSPHKGQWRGALMFSLICVWINDWVNNGEAGDLRRYRIHYDVTVMYLDTWRQRDMETLSIAILPILHAEYNCSDQWLRRIIDFICKWLIFNTSYPYDIC